MEALNTVDQVRNLGYIFVILITYNKMYTHLIADYYNFVYAEEVIGKIRLSKGLEKDGIKTSYYDRQKDRRSSFHTIHITT